MTTTFTLKKDRGPRNRGETSYRVIVDGKQIGEVWRASHGWVYSCDADGFVLSSFAGIRRRADAIDELIRHEEGRKS